MTRSSIVTANRAQAQASAHRSEFFLLIDFPAGAIRATSADRTITWGGYDWDTRWKWAPPEQVVEKPDLKPYSMTFELSGVDATLLSRVLTDTPHLARIGFWQGFFDEDWKLVADPIPLAPLHRYSTAEIEVDEAGARITVTAEGPEILWLRDSAVLATPESQRLRYPGDTGMDRVLAQNTLTIEWGGHYAVPSAPGYEGGGAMGSQGLGQVRQANHK